MTNPRYKLGATTDYMLYRDLSDSNKTKLTNDGVDVINISGTDGLTAVDIQQQNPIMRIQSLNTGVTAHSTISLGITGGDSWNLSAGVSGLSNPDTDFGFHISKNDNELMTIRNFIGIFVVSLTVVSSHNLFHKVIDYQYRGKPI